MPASIPERHHRHSKAASPAKPDPAFNRYFCNLPPSARNNLWKAYVAWQSRHINDNFARFQKYCLEMRDAAKKEVDSWTNPFVNAKKGEPYEITFDLPQCISRFEITGLKALGLAISHAEEDLRKCVIKGEPCEAGNFGITLTYIWDGWVHGLPLLQRQFNFFVNPDPRDLWEDIPSDQAEEYARPDLEFAEIASPDARMWAASRRGRSHAHTGKPRDDAIGIDFYAGWHLLAVADGAGSAEFSRKGADLACKTALAAIKEKLTHDSGLESIFMNLDPESAPASWQPNARKLAYHLLPNAAFVVNKAIRQEAEAKGREARSYATTLLLAMAKKFPGGWIVISFQIGDGAMAIFADDRSSLLAQPDEGEYGGQTRFVTMNEIFEPGELMRRLRIDFVSRLDGVLLMTDGISDARFATLEGLNNPELWLELRCELLNLAHCPDPQNAFYEWLNFWSRGNHDDRSLAMLAAER